MSVCECSTDIEFDTGSKTDDSNTITGQAPYRIPLTLEPDEELDMNLLLHADRLGEQELCLLFVYREVRHLFQLSLPPSLTINSDTDRNRAFPVSESYTSI